MKISKLSKRLPLLVAALLFATVSTGQTVYTKSGNPVLPPTHVPAYTPNILSTKHQQSDDPTRGTLLIVTTSDLRPYIASLRDWKQQQGFRVETFSTDCHNKDSIRALLKSRYINAYTLNPAQRYVILVGDVDRIPTFYGTNTPSGLSSHATDLYYGEYTGDYIPEVQVGRLSVTDSAELLTVISKIIAYEQGNWAKDNNHLLLVAGNERQSIAPLTTNAQVNYLSMAAEQLLPEMEIKCFHNEVPIEIFDSVLFALNNSNSLVNYTAHCTQRGWDNPLVTMQTIDTLENATPTLYVNNCCKSNAFNGTCFGEELLRHPTGGAAGVIGATNETLWTEDYYWAVGAQYPIVEYPVYNPNLPGAFDTLFAQKHSADYRHRENITLGSMMRDGCMAVTMAGSPFDAFYWEIYNLLGDPSMTPFIGEADSLMLTVPDSVEAGTTTLTVGCTPYARVSATKDSLLLATTLADSNGSATLLFDNALDLSNITITATRVNALYNEQTITVVPAQEPRCAVVSRTISRNELVLRLRNVGSGEVTNHKIILTQDNEDIHIGAELPNSLSATIHSLAPADDTLISWTLDNYIQGQQPMLSASLALSDQYETEYSRMHLQVSLPDHRPRLIHMEVVDLNGHAVNAITPNRDYRMAITLSDIADSVCASFNGVSTTITNHLDVPNTPIQIPFHTEEDLQYLNYVITPHAGHWKQDYSGWITAWKNTEGFETNDFSMLPWQHAPLYPWTIDHTNPHSGQYCIRSGNVNDSQKSVLTLDIDVLTGDSISFYYNVSSENSDWLYFYIDDRKCGYWSGDLGWRRYSRFVSQGRHRLQWIYQKDISISQHDDCARLDDIRLPFSTWQEPSGSPEYDSTLQIEQPETGVPSLRLQPNPNNGQVIIHTATSYRPKSLELYNSQGQLVDKIKIASNECSTQYFTTHLRLGVYMIVLHSDGNTLTDKMIVIK